MNPRLEHCEVAIVGGGISGLACALRVHELSAERRRPLGVRVFESSVRFGGQIRTERDGPRLLEAGPDQFVAYKPAALDLCRRVGLGEALVEIRSGRLPAQVLRNGRPMPLPEGFAMIAPSRLGPLFRSSLFSLPGRIRIALETLVPGRTDDAEDENLADFVTRRFGKEFLDRVIEPIFGGIFSARADALSMQVLLPRVVAMERRHRSIIRALNASKPQSQGAGFVSLRGGMATLVDALAARLPRGTAHTSVSVGGLSYARDAGAWKLDFAQRKSITADCVVLACPAYVASSLVVGFDDALAATLGRLDYASCATVNLAYRKGAPGAELRGSGFFAPRSEGLPIMACSYVSSKFGGRAPEDQVLLRAFVGGAENPEILDQADAVIGETAHRALARVLRIREEPLTTTIHRYPRSMPQFPAGSQTYLDTVRKRAERHPGLFLSGGILGAVGIPDCVAMAESTADRAFEFTSAAGRGPVMAASQL